ncbi:VWA domain-containing protein [Microcystis panniformis]|uniref:VWFA domain-containing protein n=1 Tax=Microcystis panniformis FACHB-1757 TaxID=1638788 RepID=A0A0K1SAM8_9CHRO|nr:VWA domain-containing protein [Microcystis panniformis]AKV71177.1 hypothetical protein VL20_6449 [Microcystis panniformis FACHB-1757]
MQLYHREVQAFQIPVPWLLGVTVDCTASISNRDFAIAKDQLIKFLVATHLRGRSLPGLPSDFVSVTAFKDRRNIFGPPQPLNVVKMDNESHVAALCQWVNNLRNDGGSTALYDAIKIASSELVAMDSYLPYQYLKLVLAITDGGDNNSNTRLQDLSYFLNSNLCLSVIGVGSSASSQLSSISRYATSTHSIGNFGDLYQAMTISLGVVIERQGLIQL